MTPSSITIEQHVWIDSNSDPRAVELFGPSCLHPSGNVSNLPRSSQAYKAKKKSSDLALRYCDRWHDKMLDTPPYLICDLLVCDFYRVCIPVVLSVAGAPSPEGQHSVTVCGLQSLHTCMDSRRSSASALFAQSTCSTLDCP